MRALNSRSIMTTFLVVLSALTLVRAQITFSRDWTGGKRSAPNLAMDCGQFARICRHFIHELKSAMVDQPAAVEGKRRPGRPGIEDLPPLYDEEK